MKEFFTPINVAEVVGISYRQIQYWDKTNFIKPSYRRKGRYRMYVFRDLILLQLAWELRGPSYSIQRLRPLVKSLSGLLAQTTAPPSTLSFLIEGDSVLVFSGEVLYRPGADNKNWIHFPVSDLAQRVNELFPPKEERLHG